MTTIDLKKTERPLYSAASDPELVDVPPMGYLMVDGAGNPSGPEYRAAVETLYPVAYTLRALIKEQAGLAYVVCPLEGLWWSEDMTAFVTNDKDSWLWTSLIRQPPEVTPELAKEAIERVIETRNPPAGDAIRFDVFDEGRSAQIMHVGPFADEGRTIQRLHAFIAEQGYVLAGKHHEIYLTDPRRTAPEKMRTLIRQPVG